MDRADGAIGRVLGGGTGDAELDGEAAAFEVLEVVKVYGCLGFFVGGKFDVAESGG